LALHDPADDEEEELPGLEAEEEEDGEEEGEGEEARGGDDGGECVRERSRHDPFPRARLGAAALEMLNWPIGPLKKAILQKKWLKINMMMKMGMAYRAFKMVMDAARKRKIA
jgi:hypothetical protein